MKTVSIKTVATEAGVSIATVSNVVNRPAVVSAATRDRVRAVINALGYVPNSAARHLSSGRSTAVGLVLFGVRNPYFADIARGAEDTLQQAGHLSVLCSTDLDTDREEDYLDQLAQQQIRDVLITPVQVSDPWLDRLKDRGFNFVLIHNAAEHPEICSVAVDDALGGEQAATHLLARGHESITFVTGPMNMRAPSDRYEGCLRSVLRSGRTEEALRVIEVDDFTIEQGRRAGERLLAATRPGTAVFCANDLLALGVMQAAFRAGKRIPEDLAIVGYDDIESVTTTGVPLTTVRVEGYELGRAAAQMLLDEERDPQEHVHRRKVFSPRLIERNSS
ncbi:LacI family DNA-binding transcriptional regulator [Nocardiopsis valliformis]|uniref:LacI family DNA-binding transcriptional regulator n=1 Tax=Nocardiopsis valliformis TaxID=239974 RepID=UPI00034CF38C|nr:LacI family DNA-binding transcriptional regulator [Nocardiopsis valliformis]